MTRPGRESGRSINSDALALRDTNKAVVRHRLAQLGMPLGHRPNKMRDTMTAKRRAIDEYHSFIPQSRSNRILSAAHIASMSAITSSSGRSR